MRTQFAGSFLVLAPETDEERLAIERWKSASVDHVFLLVDDDGAGLALRDLGPRPVACREPINVTSRHPDSVVRLIGNFAETPFELDGRRYRTVESFWQSLKFDEAERGAVAGMSGAEAKAAGDRRGYAATVRYEGRDLVVGTWEHWGLMRRACEAKFRQHAEARDALLATRPRPLAHRPRRESKTIPGAILAEIWMSLRESLGT